MTCDKFTCDDLTFTEEILNGKLHFLYGEIRNVLKSRRPLCFMVS